MCQKCNQNNCNGCAQEVTLCNQCSSEQPCDCPILGLSTDCILYSQDDIECNSVVVVPKNTILSDALNQIVSWSCTKFSELANYLRIINVGTGASIYAGDNLIGEKKIRRINSTSTIVTVTENTNDISLGIDATSLNTFIEANQKTYSASNVGAGSEIYKDTTIVGDNTQLNLRKIKSSNSSVSIVQGTNDIDITVSPSVIPDGSETKVTAGTNVSITGTGTIATPYVINSTDTNTTYSAGTSMSLVGTTFNNTAPDQVVTLTQGGSTTITGTYPNFTITSVDNNTTYSAGNGLALTGTVFSVENLQKIITYPTDFTGTNYTLTNADNNYEIIVDNGTTDVTIIVPSGLTSKIGIGFTQKGTADVTYVTSGTTINTPVGLKIKGQYYQTYLSQELATNVFYLGGNTRA